VRAFHRRLAFGVSLAMVVIAVSSHTASAAQEPRQPLFSKHSIISVSTTINPSDQSFIENAKVEAKAYQSALENLNAAPPGSKVAKQYFKVAISRWKDLAQAVRVAKKHIGATFRVQINAAKSAYKVVAEGKKSVSGKAAAKASRDAAIANASASRDEALREIHFDLDKPAKPID
jgi:hypothetical protein